MTDNEEEYAYEETKRQVSNIVVAWRISTENGLAEFLFHIIDQKYDKAFRRPDSIPARDEAAFKLRHAFFESKIFCYYKKVCNQIKRYQTGTLISRKRNK